MELYRIAVNRRMQETVYKDVEAVAAVLSKIRQGDVGEVYTEYRGAWCKSSLYFDRDTRQSSITSRSMDTVHNTDKAWCMFEIREGKEFVIRFNEFVPICEAYDKAIDIMLKEFGVCYVEDNHLNGSIKVGGDRVDALMTINYKPVDIARNNLKAAKQALQKAMEAYQEAVEHLEIALEEQE